jgi:hypothetical protein
MRLLPLLLLASCTSTPWLVRYPCDSPPHSVGPMVLVRCSGEDAWPYQACLYQYTEEGLVCTWQLERHKCDAWDIKAHQCKIVNETPCTRGLK